MRAEPGNRAGQLLGTWSGRFVGVVLVMLFAGAPFGPVTSGQATGTMLGAVEVVGQPDFETSSPDTFSYITANALDRKHHRLFVADSNNDKVLVYSLNSANSLLAQTPSHFRGNPDATGVTPDQT